MKITLNRILLMIVITGFFLIYVVKAEGDCELLAKNYQKDNGGQLVFIQPLKDNGAYDLGEYSGHWLNKAYSKERGIYYYDVGTGTFFKNEDEILDWYLFKAVVFDLDKGHPPFSLIWHY